MSVNQDRKFAQVPMPDWCYDNVKKIAADSGLDVKEWLDMVIRNFIKTRQSYKRSKNKHLLLFASPHKAKPRSMWIGEDEFTKLELFCDTHETRPNRVIFTACILELAEKGYIRI